MYLNPVAMKIKKEQLIIDIVAILYILIFVYTGVYKLVNHRVFYLQLIGHPLLKDYAHIVSWVVPVVEVVAALLLAFSITRMKGIYLSLATMSCFTIYLIYMIVTHPKLPCSCGGIVNSLSWRQHVMVNTLYILMGITAIILHKRKTRKFSGVVKPA